MFVVCGVIEINFQITHSIFLLSTSQCTVCVRDDGVTVACIQ